MDMNSIAATGTTLAQQAAKGALHALWVQVAAHPRAATIVSLALIVGAFIGGYAAHG